MAYSVVTTAEFEERLEKAIVFRVHDEDATVALLSLFFAGSNWKRYIRGL